MTTKTELEKNVVEKLELLKLNYTTLPIMDCITPVSLGKFKKELVALIEQVELRAREDEVRLALIEFVENTQDSVIEHLEKRLDKLEDKEGSEDG